MVDDTISESMMFREDCDYLFSNGTNMEKDWHSAYLMVTMSNANSYIMPTLEDLIREGRLTEEQVNHALHCVCEAAGKATFIDGFAKEGIQYWKIMLYAGTFAIANTSIASFLPTYLTTERGMDPTIATTISSLNSLFGIAGSLLGGVLCAQLWCRKPILLTALGLYILAGFGLTVFTSSGIIIVLALAAGTLYFVPVAYRVFFALCIIGLIGCLLLKETGRKPETKSVSH